MCGGAQRYLLYQLRNTIIKPFGETALQVFARISALRDSLDGPQVDPGPMQSWAYEIPLALCKALMISVASCSIASPGPMPRLSTAHVSTSRTAEDVKYLIHFLPTHKNSYWCKRPGHVQKFAFCSDRGRS